MPEAKPTFLLLSMSIFNNNLYALFLRVACVAISCCTIASAQDNCNFTLSGSISDEGSGLALPFAQVQAVEATRSIMADENGYFQLKNLCGGAYHLRINHIGCEAVEYFFELKRDTVFNITLQHHSELVDEVVIHGSKSQHAAHISHSLQQEEIRQQGNKNLADILENIVGVSVLRNGSGISKPVIHGLYGNRVSILNNGIVQSGQQWGNDHAPEIDPFAAEHVAVVKGAAVVEYGGNTLGGVVLVERDPIAADPHLHGKLNYIAESNAWAHTLHTDMEQQAKWAAWRVGGTLKIQGGARAPDYWLNNTGKREANFSVQLEKNLFKYWNSTFYYSLFNTNLGILRGSHIGNISDLETAIHSDIPFFTESSFSYQLESPRQSVQHHLWKIESKRIFNDKNTLKLQYSTQINRRREFDVRRGGRSDIPALSLAQQTHFAGASYQRSLSEKWWWKSGVQLNIVDNTNNPETGILPLIPDYLSYQSGIYSVLQRESEDWLWEGGVRYDFKYFDVVRIVPIVPYRIERRPHYFHHFQASAGMRYAPDTRFKWSANVGWASRAPDINELYSAGLHQGVSGIEEGNPNLLQETSLKGIVAAEFFLNNKLFIQATAYYQHISNYIYLQAQNEFRLTIRGAFPLYVYEQTQARLYGTDAVLSYEWFSGLKFQAKYAFVRGDDVSQSLPLPYMPPANFHFTCTYTPSSAKNRQRQTFIQIQSRYVAEQKHLQPQQDFLAPPSGYWLLGVGGGSDFEWKKHLIKVSLQTENLLNARYRDYLNRLRYFSDEKGINVMLRVAYKW